MLKRDALTTARRGTSSPSKWSVAASTMPARIATRP